MGLGDSQPVCAGEQFDLKTCLKLSPNSFMTESGRIITYKEVSANSPAEARTLREGLEARLKWQGPQFVNLLGFRLTKCSGACHASYQFDIWCQSMSSLWQNLSTLTTREAVEQLAWACEGLDRLSTELQTDFKVTERMLAFNQHGHLKIWCSQDFSSPQPQFPVSIFGAKNRLLHQHGQVLSLFQKAALKSYENMPGKVAQLLYQRRVGFKEAAQVLRGYLMESQHQLWESMASQGQSESGHGPMHAKRVPGRVAQTPILGLMGSGKPTSRGSQQTQREECWQSQTGAVVVSPFLVEKVIVVNGGDPLF